MDLRNMEKINTVVTVHINRILECNRKEVNMGANAELVDVHWKYYQLETVSSPYAILSTYDVSPCVFRPVIWPKVLHFHWLDS